jgi:hypothetical protein
MQYYTMEPSSLLDLDRSPLVDAAVVLLFVALAALGTLLGMV